VECHQPGSIVLRQRECVVIRPYRELREINRTNDDLKFQHTSHFDTIAIPIRMPSKMLRLGSLVFSVSRATILSHPERRRSECDGKSKCPRSVRPSPPRGVLPKISYVASYGSYKKLNRSRTRKPVHSWDSGLSILLCKRPILDQAAKTIAKTGNSRHPAITLDPNLLASRAYVDPFLVAAIYAGLGDKEHAFQLLEQGYKLRSGSMTFLKTDPF